MRAAGLVERSELPQFQPTAVAIREPLLGARLRVFDDVVEVRGNDGALLTEVLEPFGSLAESDVNWNGSQVHAVGIQADGGQIRVYGMGHDQRVETVADAVEVVASLVNTSVRSSSTVLALHAGAVRSRDGKVVVMAGASGSGKSTLTAALVRAGWDYLTDEAVGIRGLPPGAVGYPKPLALDADSRRLLGLASHPYAVTPPSELLAGGVASSGEARSVSMVFILQGPDHSSSAVSQPPIEWLDPAEALASIAPHSINLTAAGDRGLETLAHLCLDVPTARVLQTGLEAMVEHVELAAR
jgi:hypothetical protein